MDHTCIRRSGTLGWAPHGVDGVRIAVCGGAGEKAGLDVEGKESLLFVRSSDLQGHSFLEELPREGMSGGLVIGRTGLARHRTSCA